MTTQEGINEKGSKGMVGIGWDMLFVFKAVSRAWFSCSMWVLVALSKKHIMLFDAAQHLVAKEICRASIFLLSSVANVISQEPADCVLQSTVRHHEQGTNESMQLGPMQERSAWKFLGSALAMLCGVCTKPKWLNLWQVDSDKSWIFGILEPIWQLFLFLGSESDPCIHIIHELLRSCFNCMAMCASGPKSPEGAGRNNPGCGTAQATLNQEAAWWLLSKSPALPAGPVPRTPQHHRNWNPDRGVKELNAPEIQVTVAHEILRYSGSVKSWSTKPLDCSATQLWKILPGFDSIRIEFQSLEHQVLQPLELLNCMHLTINTATDGAGLEHLSSEVASYGRIISVYVWFVNL